MSLIRPELRQWLARWGEPLAAAGVALLGLWLIWHGYQRVNWITEGIGLVLAALGAALFWASFQRSRFSPRQQGPGLVEVNERRITYLTSLGGSSVDIAAMTRLEMRTHSAFGRYWILRHEDGVSLYIPTEATGAESLFDAFSALPGIEPGKLIAAQKETGTHRNVIWRRAGQFPTLT